MTQSATTAPDFPGGVGVVPLEQVAGMSGMEFLTRMAAGELPAPPIAQTLGFVLTEVAPGRAVFAGTPTLAHYNPIGSVHGGWIATLLDSCMACSVHTMLEAGKQYTSAEIKVNYVRAVTDRVGELKAIGEVVHRGGRLATAEGRLVDAQGKLFAHGTTTCIILR